MIDLVMPAPARASRSASARHVTHEGRRKRLRWIPAQGGDDGVLKIFLSLLIVALLSTPALAFSTKPAPTSALYIAMLYHKLSGDMPDFTGWTKQWDTYQKTEMADRPALLESRVGEMTNTFNLMTPAEPIVVQSRIRLSGYSATNQGFLVQNFNDVTFFSYNYMGKRYALIPGGMAKYQWLKAPANMADAIMRETDNGASGKVTLTLISMRADPKPLEMNGKAYNLLMADISKIELWSKDGKTLVWDSQIGESKGRKDLLNLRP
ncbi:MAG: hypothetical protein IT560_10645 [Alphaproteobacteria bacterium]|nr:hypothetical protein [Alphaproteobacteria bacterium]